MSASVMCIFKAESCVLTFAFLLILASPVNVPSFRNLQDKEKELVIQMTPEMLKVNCYFRTSMEAQAVNTQYSCLQGLVTLLCELRLPG